MASLLLVLPVMRIHRNSYFAALAAVALASFSVGCQSSVRGADAWDELFQQQRTDQGWTGGDGAYSVSLPAGRTLWLFGDSVLGSAQDGRRANLEYRFGNTIAIQQNPQADGDPSVSSIKFDWGAPSSNGWLPIFDDTLDRATIPQSLARARASGRNTAAWAMHGIVVQNDLLLFNAIATPGDCESCGFFNFQVHGSTLSLIAGVDRPYEAWGFESGLGWRSDSRPLQRFVEPGRAGDNGATILWGLYLVPDPEQANALLIYGHRSDGAVGELVVARVSPVEQAADAMDFGRWSYWDGELWASSPESARGILGHVATELSVSRVPGDAEAGWAVVHAGDGLDGAVHVALGSSPLGPFSERYVLRLSDCPPGGFDRESPPLAYAIKAHPELSTEDELLVSVVLARTDTNTTAEGSETGYYVPRFLHLPWHEILDHSQSSRKRCEAKS